MSTVALPECTDPGVICAWAGTGDAGFDGDHNSLLESDFYFPIDVTFAGDQGTYLVDWNNHKVRSLLIDGTLETVIGTDFIGDGPEDESDQDPPGALGTEVLLNHPTQITPWDDGLLLLVAWHNHKLRTYSPETGRVVVIGGGPPGFGGDGGSLREAVFNQPSQIVRELGVTYVFDQRNQVVRSIDANGIVQTVAGTTGQAGYDGDGASPRSATFDFPAGSNPSPAGGLAVDGAGRLYVADTLNHAIRRVDFDADTIDTLCGTGSSGMSPADGSLAELVLNNPRHLRMGPDGRLFIADQDNHRILAVDLDAESYVTVAGGNGAGDSGDGELATVAWLNRPSGISFDPSGALYIADTYNHRFRRVLSLENRPSQ